MKKIITRLFAPFAVFAMIIGVGIALQTDNNPIVSRAAAGDVTTHSFKSSIPSGWTPSVKQSGFETTNRGAQFTNGSIVGNGLTITYANEGTFDQVSVTAATNGTASNTKITIDIGGEVFDSVKTLTSKDNTKYTFEAPALTGQLKILVSTTNTSKSTYISEVTTREVQVDFGDLDRVEVDFSNTQTTFMSGETFTSQGVVLTAFDTDGNQLPANLTGTNFDNHVFTNSDIGTKQVIVDYEIEGNTGTVSYDINVLAGPFYADDFGSMSANPAWSGTHRSRTFSDIVSGKSITWTMTGGNVYNGYQFGVDSSGNDAQGDFAGFSTIQGSYSDIAIVKGNDFTLSNLSRVEFSWTGKTYNVNPGIAVSTDFGATWTSLAQTSSTSTGGDTLVWEGTQSQDLSIAFYGVIAGGSSFRQISDPSFTIFADSFGEDPLVLDNIEIVSNPTKMSYYENENFDSTGLSVRANYNDDTFVDVTNDVTFSTTLTVGQTSLLISYTDTELATTKTVELTGLVVNAVTLNSISIKTQASKVVFGFGEDFSHPGLVLTGHYNNGDVDITEGFTVSGYDKTRLGTQTITVDFEGKTTTYEITLTNENYVYSAINATDLFISEYYEGDTGNNKAIELFNGTGKSINLSGYSLKINVNAYTTWSSAISLGNASIADGDTFVVAHLSSNSTILDLADLKNGNLTHNGDDAIGLFKNDQLIDIFGIFGEDPGDGWEVDGVKNATEDHSLTRISNIISPTDSWNTSEWIVNELSNNTLGEHTFSASIGALEQAIAFANFVQNPEEYGIDYGNVSSEFDATNVIGFGANGNCEEIYSDLIVEFNLMDEEAKTIFNNDSEHIEIINARARMDYLESWVAANSGGSSVSRPSATNNSNNLIAVVTIGAISLTSLLGFYFINKNKKNA